MTTTHHTTVIRLCDICKHPHGGTAQVVAHYDAKLKTGPWANVCRHHLKTMAAHQELGTGRGQEFIYPEAVIRQALSEGILSDSPAAILVTAYRGYDLHQSQHGGWVDIFFQGESIDGQVSMDAARATIDSWMAAR